MIKKQRVTKLLSILSVSLGIIVVTLFSNTQNIKAYTSNTTPYTIESHMGEVNALHTELIVTINFADYYSGYITFSIYNISGQPVSYYAINSKLTNMTNTGFRTVVYQTKYAEVHIFYETQSTIQAAYNLGYIASATFGLFSTYLNTHWKTTTDVRSTSYSSSTLYVDSPVDEINETVATIETNIDTTNDLLTQLINNGIQLNGAVTTNVTVNSGTVWPLYTTNFILMMNKMGFTWNVSTQSQLTVGTGLSGLTSQSSRNQFVISGSKTLHIIYYSNSTGLYLKEDHSTNDLANVTRQIVNNISGVVLLHVTITNPTTSNINAWWYMNNSGQYFMPVYWGYDPPDEVLEMISEDTSIISKMNEILEAIQDINITVENNQEINNIVNNKDTIITNITNNHNTVNNITNDFALDFDSADNAITFNTDIINNLTDAATFWNSKLGEVELAMGDFQYPVVLGFILLAVLALIGV